MRSSHTLTTDEPTTHNGEYKPIPRCVKSSPRCLYKAPDPDVDDHEPFPDTHFYDVFVVGREGFAELKRATRGY